MTARRPRTAPHRPSVAGRFASRHSDQRVGEKFSLRGHRVLGFGSSPRIDIFRWHFQQSPRAGTLRGIDAVADFIRRSAVDGERSRHTTTDLLVDVSGDRAAASANSLVYYYRVGGPGLQGGWMDLMALDRHVFPAL
ncbi:nuclear transport factor 2 family protein [Nocardia fusca]|uniref:nuclear transport factor 2 family protein n=1 Tax=Nocardia fusca TaxID=941183 RepID=UPI0037880989